MFESIFLVNGAGSSVPFGRVMWIWISAQWLIFDDFCARTTPGLVVRSVYLYRSRLRVIFNARQVAGESGSWMPENRLVLIVDWLRSRAAPLWWIISSFGSRLIRELVERDEWRGDVGGRWTFTRIAKLLKYSAIKKATRVDPDLMDTNGVYS